MNVRESLERILGKHRVAADPTNRLLYSRDMMSGGLLEAKAGHLAPLPHVVCWPEDLSDLCKVIQFAGKHKIPIVPFGAGSGVSGGTVPVRGGIMIDLKRMNRLEKIEMRGDSFYATAQCGILGEHLEAGLNSRGFTLGHFPSSILCATLGGYLACRSAGQLSSRYGKIEDMTDAVEVVLPNGRVIPLGGKVQRLPRVRATDLFVGSEGCLGVITKARLRVFPLPPSSHYRGILFPRLDKGLQAAREVMQAGLEPSVVRLYDPIDSMLLKHGYQQGGGISKLLRPLFGMIPIPREAMGRRFHQWLLSHPRVPQALLESLSPAVLLILSFEGDPILVAAREQEALALCQKSSGKDLGERPGLHWLEHRYSVSFKMPKVFEMNSFVDTIEVATTWDNLKNLYDRMKEALAPAALVLAHFSHAYPEGCSIYFTVVAKGASVEGDLSLYKRLWHDAMEGCLAAGGTISHHHGIGLLKARYLPRELGGMMDLYHEMKKKLDPRGIMNPGKMGL